MAITKDDLNRFEEIIDDMGGLLDEAYQIARRSGSMHRAQAYFYPAIADMITDHHASMKTILEEMKEEVAENAENGEGAEDE